VPAQQTTYVHWAQLLTSSCASHCPSSAQWSTQHLKFDARERSSTHPKHAGAPAATAATADPAQHPASCHDFDEYLRQMRGWEDNMRASPASPTRACGGAAGNPADTATTSGKVLAEVKQRVPTLFFHADFDIGNSATFRKACPIHLKDETRVGHELAAHLDLVRFFPASTECSVEGETNRMSLGVFLAGGAHRLRLSGAKTNSGPCRLTQQGASFFHTRMRVFICRTSGVGCVQVDTAISKEVTNRAVDLVTVAGVMADLKRAVRQLHFKSAIIQHTLHKQHEEAAVRAKHVSELKQQCKNLSSMHEVRRCARRRFSGLCGTINIDDGVPG
jgi:hypothetical protein